MSSPQIKILIVIILVISGACTILLFFRPLFAGITCQDSDPRICSVKRALKKESLDGRAGSYTNTIDESTTEYLWKKGKENDYSLEIIENGEPTLKLIVLEKYVYLFDSSDDLWWKQKLLATRQYTKEWPFEAQNYWTNIKNIFLSDRVVFKYQTESDCIFGKCYQYGVDYVDNSSTQYFIDVDSKGNIIQNITKDLNTQKIFKIFPKINNKKDFINSPKSVKMVEDDINIFLEYTKKKNIPENKDFEYLKQFEIERSKSETDTNAVTPTQSPVPSENQ